MTPLEFAKRWVESTWQSDFRYGVITYDPGQYDPDRPPSKEQQKELIEEQSRFANINTRIIDGLRASLIGPGQAREAVANEGLEDRILISTTKEELIHSIASVLNRGADLWYNPGKFAWFEGGIFSVNFYHDIAPVRKRPSKKRGKSENLRKKKGP